MCAAAAVCKLGGAGLQDYCTPTAHASAFKLRPWPSSHSTLAQAVIEADQDTVASYTCCDTAALGSVGLLTVADALKHSGGA